MIEGEDSSPRRSPGGHGDDARVWRHPSEVGMATRGRADRRRSSRVASGIVLGGVGLLVVGVLMGRDSEPPPVASAPAPMERAAASLAAVTVVDPDGASHRATAVVLDRQGHLVLHAATVADAAEVWARTPDGSVVRADVVGSDGEASVAVLRPEGPTPDAVRAAPELPDVGSTVHLLQRDRAGLRVEAATLGGPTDPVRLAGLELPQASPASGWSLSVDGTTPSAGATASTAIGATPAAIGLDDDARSGSAVAVDDDGRLIGLVDLGASTAADDGSYEMVPARGALRAASSLLDDG